MYYPSNKHQWHSLFLLPFSGTVLRCWNGPHYGRKCLASFLNVLSKSALKLSCQRQAVNINLHFTRAMSWIRSHPCTHSAPYTNHLFSHLSRNNGYAELIVPSTFTGTYYTLETSANLGSNVCWSRREFQCNCLIWLYQTTDRSLANSNPHSSSFRRSKWTDIQNEVDVHEAKMNARRMTTEWISWQQTLEAQSQEDCLTW